MRAGRSSAVGLGLALLSAATFGTSGTFARSLIEAGWSAGAAVATRVAIDAMLLSIPALVAVRGRWPVVRRALGSIGAFGLLAVAGTQVAYFYAVQYLPVGVALLIEYSGIILVVLWMWVVHGQRPRRLTVAGAVAAVVGLVLVLNLAGGVHLHPIGILWAVIAAVGLAAYFVLSARIDPELPATALAAGGMGFGTVILVALGLIGVLPMHATFGHVSFAGYRTSWLVPVVGLSLVAAVFSYVAGIGAARILGASLASFVGLTEVLFAVLIAWVALDELPTVIQAVGGALIVAGIALVRLDSMRSPESVAAAEEESPEPVASGAR